MIAIDFETYYSDDLNIASHGTKNYCLETDIYLVSMLGEGVDFVGHPADAPWAEIDGKEVCAHNASFDEVVFDTLIEKQIIPPTTAHWHCTADACAARQLPRSLANAMSALDGTVVDKSVRDKMKGKMWNTLSLPDQKAAVDYARRDAEYCLTLADKVLKDLPAFERRLSEHTRMMGKRGVYVDEEYIEVSLDGLREHLQQCDRGIPWANELDAKSKRIPITSPKALAAACASAGIPAPITTARNDERFDKWASEYADRAPWVAAIQRHRRINRGIHVLEAMKSRIQESGRMGYNLKYYGAEATGRWSGDNGLNMQNLPKSPLEGVLIREALIAAPGKKLLVLDFSQIEARVAMWLGSNHKILLQLKNGVDLYEAYARAMMNYHDPRPLKEVDPDLRFKVKGMGLGLQFALGPARFSEISGVPLDEATNLVHIFRQNNPGIVQHWGVLNHRFQTACSGRLPFCSNNLPSGRTITYWAPGVDDGVMRASIVKGGPRYKWYGGILFQNVVQGIARDILGNAVLALEDAGLPVVLHVHDEVIMEVDADNAAEAFEEAKRIMSTPAPWAKEIPLAVEGHILDRYTK